MLWLWGHFRSKCWSSWFLWSGLVEVYVSPRLGLFCRIFHQPGFGRFSSVRLPSDVTHQQMLSLIFFCFPRWSSSISPVSSWATLSSIVGQFTSQSVTVMDLHCLKLHPWLCVCSGTRRCTRSVCCCLDPPSAALRSGSCGSWLCCRSEFCISTEEVYCDLQDDFSE